MTTDIAFENACRDLHDLMSAADLTVWFQTHLPALKARVRDGGRSKEPATVARAQFAMYRARIPYYPYGITEGGWGRISSEPLKLPGSIFLTTWVPYIPRVTVAHLLKDTKIHLLGAENHPGVDDDSYYIALLDQDFPNLAVSLKLNGEMK